MYSIDLVRIYLNKPLWKRRPKNVEKAPHTDLLLSFQGCFLVPLPGTFLKYPAILFDAGFKNTKICINLGDQTNLSYYPSLKQSGKNP